MTDAFNKEMEKLERQQKGLHNQYEQENIEFNKEEYQRQLNADKILPYAMEWQEPLQQYVIKLQAYVKIASEENWEVHVVNKGRGCWYTHKRNGAASCFMCKDAQMYRYLMNMLTAVSQTSPKFTLK